MSGTTSGDETRNELLTWFLELHRFESAEDCHSNDVLTKATNVETALQRAVR